MIREERGEVPDELTTNSFYVARVRCSGMTLGALARMREVAHIDRPVTVRTEVQKAYDAGEVGAVGRPEPGMPGILVVDSGVNNHPLLKNAIGGRRAHPSDDGGVVAGRDLDEAGHGTSVAGVALYGDIERHSAKKPLNPQLWIYSAKVMHEEDNVAVFDTDSLVEHQLKDAVEYACATYKNCRIVNISFGDAAPAMEDGSRQFRIASLIDELSAEHQDLSFVIAAGNLDRDDTYKYSYPDVFANPPAHFRVIDPATSGHGITVGSIEQPQKDAAVWPSKFTRVGPGLRGMIKPELVEIGGNERDDGIQVLNPRWVSEGKLFTRDWGTSISAPAVSHLMAVLAREFPDASRNLLTALALSSASVPEQRPGLLGKLDERANSANMRKMLAVYGYGRPNLDHALYSDSDRVVLKYEGTIGMRRVSFFPLILPDEFYQQKGVRSIEVSLAYDPPTDAKRVDYAGVTIDYSLYKNTPLNLVNDAYDAAASGGRAGDSIGKRLKNCKVRLLPGPLIRKTSAHQKSSVVYHGTPSIDIRHPLVLAVSCQRKWYPDANYMQKYALVVTARHSGGIDLYNGIKQNIPERLQMEMMAA